MPEIPSHCRRCARAMPDEVRHKARGLCRLCYQHVREHGMRDAYPRLTKAGPGRPAKSTLVEDFYFIAADSGERSIGTRIGYTRETRRIIAARLGVTFETLDRALLRKTAPVSVAATREPEESEGIAA